MAPTHSRLIQENATTVATAATTTTIEDLPNEMLYMILSNVDLMQRIRVRRVSRRWTVIVNDLLRQVTKVTICKINDDNNTNVTMNRDELLIRPSDFKAHVLSQISRLMPAVEELDITCDASFGKLTALLKKYPQLTSLTLRHKGHRKLARPLPTSLSAAINANTSITRLELHQFNKQATTFLAQLAPTMRRLQKFAFVSDVRDFDDFLRLNALSAKCTDLAVSVRHFDLTNIGSVAPNVTNLELFGLVPFSIKENLSVYFPALVSLHLCSSLVSSVFTPSPSPSPSPLHFVPMAISIRPYAVGARIVHHAPASPSSAPDRREA